MAPNALDGFSESKARLIAKEILESELKGKVDWENHAFEVRPQKTE
jgi:hypothetical protein